MLTLDTDSPLAAVDTRHQTRARALRVRAQHARSTLGRQMRHQPGVLGRAEQGGQHAGRRCFKSSVSLPSTAAAATVPLLGTLPVGVALLQSRANTAICYRVWTQSLGDGTFPHPDPPTWMDQDAVAAGSTVPGTRCIMYLVRLVFLSLHAPSDSCRGCWSASLHTHPPPPV